MSQGVASEPQPLRTSFLFTMRLEIRKVNELGITPYGRRRVVDVNGGRFDGPVLSGVVRCSGADEALVRTDEVFDADVRLILESTDGALIRLAYKGRWRADPGHMDRLLRREGDLTEGNSVLRVFGLFETADERYLRLNGIVAAGVGRPTPEGIVYDFYEIL
jgi:hypothetical protein